jgi:three-Cys-motif partner protein
MKGWGLIAAYSDDLGSRGSCFNRKTYVACMSIHNPNFSNMIAKEPKPSWGGPWTDKKLQAFEDYVIAYLKIMNANPYWETIYFDGFAGSGDKGNDSNPLYLELEFTETEEKIYQGAAERVSKLIEPYRFDYYYFIEKDDKSINQLQARIDLLNKDKKGKTVFRPGDCNGELLKLASALKQTKSARSKSLKYAALLFLDPFGMQVEWSSIEQLRGTKSDVWILLPTAVIVNRLLDKKGKLKSIKKLEAFFGMKEEEIKQSFYVPTGQADLFSSGSDHYSKVANPIQKIADIYIAKMKNVWDYVTERPLRLDNRTGAPLFHFVFATNNKSALNIANDIIKTA